MAKRKTPKVKDLRPQNITEQELQRLQELVGLIQKGEMNLGQLEVQKHTLLHRIIAVQEQVGALQKEFQETYGKVDINIQDGTISYSEDVEANKKD